MDLIATAPIADYLKPAPLVESTDASIGAFVDMRLAGYDPVEAARRAFAFVRDDVAHSWDIQSRRVTRSAVDTLAFREGICYAKSHLLAAMLRRTGIPAAICYQRLTLDDPDDSAGHVIHALNAVYVDGGWHRLDARGNKPGVNAEFSLAEERLAFPIRDRFDECDYPTLYATPHPAIVRTLTANHDAIEMYRNGLPDRLDPV
jgi:transglutaminase-like putative cysteine protease